MTCTKSMGGIYCLNNCRHWAGPITLSLYLLLCANKDRPLKSCSVSTIVAPRIKTPLALNNLKLYELYSHVPIVAQH